MLTQDRLWSEAVILGGRLRTASYGYRAPATLSLPQKITGRLPTRRKARGFAACERGDRRAMTSRCARAAFSRARGSAVSVHS